MASSVCSSIGIWDSLRASSISKALSGISSSQKSCSGEISTGCVSSFSSNVGSGSADGAVSLWRDSSGSSIISCSQPGRESSFLCSGCSCCSGWSISLRSKSERSINSSWSSGVICWLITCSERGSSSKLIISISSKTSSCSGVVSSISCWLDCFFSFSFFSTIDSTVSNFESSTSQSGRLSLFFSLGSGISSDWGASSSASGSSCCQSDSTWKGWVSSCWSFCSSSEAVLSNPWSHNGIGSLEDLSSDSGKSLILFSLSIGVSIHSHLIGIIVLLINHTQLLVTGQEKTAC